MARIALSANSLGRGCRIVATAFTLGAPSSLNELAHAFQDTWLTTESELIVIALERGYCLADNRK